jgi:4-hydroxybenzoate polyprenyltransferase
MEKAGYALLLIVAAAWLVAMVVGMVAAFPFGLLGLVALVGIGLLLIKVLREHLTSKEDRYYSKNVDK